MGRAHPRPPGNFLLLQDYIYVKQLKLSKLQEKHLLQCSKFAQEV
jgi:hypothetical protein